MKLNDTPPLTPDSARSRYWKTTEDALLREHYAASGPQYCVAVLGRSLASVYCRAHALGLKPPSTARRGRPRQRWHASEEIDALIRAAWLTPSRGFTHRVAAQVGRPKWWCCKRASQLGLAQPVLANRPWTSAEDDMVGALAHLTPTTIARRMNAAGHPRSASAVVVRLKRLGVSRRQARLDEGLLSANQLAAVMGVDLKTVLRWIEREGLPATRISRSNGVDGAYEVAVNKLRLWLPGRAALIDLRKVDRYWFFDVAFGA